MVTFSETARGEVIVSHKAVRTMICVEPEWVIIGIFGDHSVYLDPEEWPAFFEMVVATNNLIQSRKKDDQHNELHSIPDSTQGIQGIDENPQP